MRGRRPSNRGLRLRTIALTACALLVTAAGAGPGVGAAREDPPRQRGSDGWDPGKPPLSTPWTDQVSPKNAHPEYPRPQLVRPRWRSLNGVWQYSTGSAPGSFTDRVLVPYPPESALSGVQHHDDRMWYRRTFEVPPDWHGDRLLLHFGAVDQSARVWLNGQEVAHHEGGYGGFDADVTDALRGTGPQELIVEATDRGDNADFSVGKQTSSPGGIYYTQSSGIWQSVWMEPVPATHLTGVDVAPHLADSAFTVTPRVTGPTTPGLHAEAVVSEPGGRTVARADGEPGTALRLPVPNPRLWSPQDPYLYTVRVRLVGPDGTGDEVSSYAGMREVGLLPDAQGRPRLALNGHILFQQGVLDQGYWPDGLYTSPTDAARRFDLEQAKRLGFNMVRKHAKVEPQRWYYWADRLGLLVWQDMPSLPSNNDIQPPNPNPPRSEAAKERFRSGLRELVEQHRNSPAVVGWVPFNEGWGEFDTAQIAEMVRHIDPTRPVDASSGVNCCFALPDSGAGDIYDDHSYVGPGRPQVTGRRASVDGEYGGLGLVREGHVWPGEPNAYEMEHSPAELTRRYGEVSDALVRLVPNNGLSAAVYTQLTDVENEVNGLLTYDRREVKPDTAAVAEHNRRAIGTGSQ